MLVFLTFVLIFILFLSFFISFAIIILFLLLRILVFSLYFNNHNITILSLGKKIIFWIWTLLFFYIFFLTVRKPIFAYFDIFITFELEDFNITKVLLFIIIVISCKYLGKILLHWTNIVLKNLFKIIKSKIMDKKSPDSALKATPTDSTLKATSPRIWIIPPLVQLYNKDPSLSGPANPAHTNSTLYKAKMALYYRQEANSLYIVLNKLDRELPLGTPRTSAFFGEFMRLHKSFLYWENMYWKDLYRGVIMKSSKIRSAELSSPSTSGSSTPTSVADDNTQTVFSNSINMLSSLL